MSISYEPSLKTASDIQGFLLSTLAERLQVNPQAIDMHEPFVRHGLDSIAATRLLGELAERLGRSLSPTLLWRYPTIEALARYLGASAATARESTTSAMAQPNGALDEPIAILGMACRFPRAPDLTAFWHLIRDGVDAITEFPNDRRPIEDNSRSPGKSERYWGGFLDQVDGFDAAFFGISPREAITMDPQQRLMLELSWEALEDGGIGPLTLKGSATGVFFGAMWADYARLADNTREPIVQHTATGQDLSIIPGRVSYSLGLEGPSLVVNTACSSSLVAVHLACQSLREGECSLALVGGVNLLLAPESTLAMSSFGGLSPDGRCFTFDARANGYVRGEGGGVVVLKRLSRALADGDPIYGIIRGSAVNNDGASNGLTAPNPQAQENVLRSAYEKAGIDPSTVTYVEAHGTGTQLGDPIEAGAIGAVLGADRPAERPLFVGSAKTNLGHLEPAAGIVGLVKAALCLENRAIPPSLHFETPNPHIPFAELGLVVPRVLIPLPENNQPITMGVSSFGFGGTNCHIVVQSLGGRRAEKRAIRSERLEAPHPSPAPNVVFVFSGQGSQWPGMGWSLLRSEPIFRTVLEQCDRFIRHYLGWSLLVELTRSSAESRLNDVELAWPSIVSFEIALAALWRSWGIEPHAVVGHSIGEIAAAHVAGVLTLDDAMRVVCAQARLIRRKQGQGAMGIVALSWEEAGHVVSGYGGRLHCAIHADLSSTVLSGEPSALAEVFEVLQGQGVFCCRVQGEVAAHCPDLNALADELFAALQEIRPTCAWVPMVSASGGAVIEAQTYDAAYWVRNFIDPVFFSEAITSIACGDDVFVEVSPHPLLRHSIEANLRQCGCQGTVLPSVRRDEDERTVMLETLDALQMLGASSVSATKASAFVLPLSAKSPSALHAMAGQLRDHLDTQADVALADIAFSLATTRSPMEHRFAVVATSREALRAALNAASQGQTPPGVVRGAATSQRGKVAFLFTGQGAQVPGMGRGLHAAWPAFRQAFDRCAVLFDEQLGRSLRDVMWAEPGSHEAALLDQTAFTQPALFTLEYALVALWRSWGIEPDFVAGHSIGEVVAACVAGVFSLEDAVRLVAARGQLMQALPAGGAMVSIAASETDVAAVVAQHADAVSIAAINGPDQVVIAGLEERVQAIAALFAERGVRTRRLPVSHAFHSPLMEPMLAAFERVAASITYRRPSIPLISNVSGKVIDDEGLSPTYWVRHVREAVRFADGVRTLHEAGACTFIEVGPRPALLGQVPACLPDAEPTLLASMPTRREEVAGILEALGGFWANGGFVEWTAVYSAGAQRVSLPTYPWQRQRYWFAGASPPNTSPPDPSPPNPLSNFAPTALRGEGEPDKPQRSFPPLHAALRSNAELERGLGGEARATRSSLQALVRGVVASVLGFNDPGPIEPGRGFRELGLDSLMAVQVRKRLQEELNIPLPVTLAFNHPTVDRIVAHLLTDVLKLEDPTEVRKTRTEIRTPRSVVADEPIAIIGAACRLPGGVEDLDAYWQLLADQVIATTEVPADRWSPADWYDPNPDASGKTYVTKAGFLREVQGFDAAFFRISPREATSLDPQQRLLLETSWEALERAGQNPAALSETPTGVFVGITTNDYAERVHYHPDAAVQLYGATGNMPSVAAGRLSFFLGLHGPTLAVDTACSSSLVALHLACQSLRQGECNQALVGGVNALLSPQYFVMLSRLRALAPDGRCKTFSAAADGYARAEGCAVVVLKRLSDAQRDGDRILALIRGTAINHDGPSSGLTVPSGTAQQAVLRQALAQAGVAATDVDYVECHGTGTPLGDPIEVQALDAVYSHERPLDRPLVLGSVKANIGHLEPAAGLAGLLKVIVALEHEQIPGQPSLGDLNPHLPWDSMPVVVPRVALPWRRGPRPRRAGLSAFGMSGTNAHVVLEEGPGVDPQPELSSRAAELVVLSAKTLDAVAAQASTLARHMKVHPDLDLGDVAFSLATTRASMELRLATVATSRDALQVALDAFAQGQTPPWTVRGRPSSGGPPKVVFVFPGQGSQWLGMGQQLLASEPAFRDALHACDRVIQAEAGWSLLEVLADVGPSSRLNLIDVVQPALFAIEVALAALWQTWGVTPDLVVGHSMGEVAAAHVAGALSLEDAVTIICRRSQLLRQISGQGEMAVVELSLSEAEALLHGYEDRLSVAVSNSPRSTVLSGEPKALAAVLETLSAKNVFWRRIKVDVASHSPQVDPLRGELLAALGDIQPRQTSIAMHSTVKGDIVAGPELTASYWVDNLRQPVRFSEAVQALLESGHGLFIEMSPHPILTTSIEEIRKASAGECVAMGSLRRGQDERPAMLESLGTLWVHGYPVAWERQFPAGARRVPLPTYPWQRELYWLENRTHRAIGSRGQTHAGGHPLLGERQTLSTAANTHLWETTLHIERLPWLDDHRVQGTVVMPGAAYLEMALSAGYESFAAHPFQVADVVIAEALAFAEDAAVPVQLVTTEQHPGRLQFQIATLAPGAGRSSWRVHARGTLRQLDRIDAPARLDLGALRARLSDHLPAATVYAELTAMGLEYGPAFRGLAEVWRGERGDGEALGRLRLPEAAGASAAFRMHPALLDACFHVMASTFDSTEATPWVPVEVGSVQLFQRPAGELWCYARRVSHDDPERQRAFLQIVDNTGAVVAEVSGLVLQRLASGTRRREEDDWFLQIDWESAAVPAPKVTAGLWLLLGNGDGLGNALRLALEAAGHGVVHAMGSHPSTTGMRTLLADAFGGQAPTVIVHLGSLDGGTDLETALVHGCDSVVDTVQAVAGMGWRDAPRLWLVTRGAQAVGNRELSITQAPLLGLGRVIALEHAELRCTRIDLDPSPPQNELDTLLAELLASDDEEEIALRVGGRRVARLARIQPDVGRREIETPAGDRPFRVEIDEPGVIDRLVLRAIERRAPAPGEVQIAVEAAGLNFIDVMKVLGIYPGLGDGPLPLGGECAGRIVAVGEGVEHVCLGQDVVAIAPFSFGTHVTVDARLVVPRPSTLTAAQAAALPIVLMTAWYGLVTLGRLTAGERVLIHSATGGTGLAAMQIARHLGAEIFATAGTPEKRAWLRAQGVTYVMDSRSLDFAEQVLAMTNGEGVHVVLNSLSGAAIDASLATLGPDGRFIELGKTDIYANRSLGLAHFKKSLSYSAVDLAGLIERRPEHVGELLAKVLDLLADGVLAPLPVEEFPIARVTDAFRKMAQAQHLGKLVLTLNDPHARIRVPEESRAAIRADGSYLVTGGLGGLGLCVAKWLAEQGAGHLVLIGRSGATNPEQQTAITSLEASGARVTVAKADVTNRAQLQRVLDDVARTGIPLRGVVHAAGLLDDAMLLRQDHARFRKVMAPKVEGAWQLHELTREVPLDFFVMYASAAGLLGSPGQANYAAANSFLDALAHHRKAQGLPALSIDWGAFAGVGLAAAEDNRGARLASRGMRSLTADEGLSALRRLLDGGHAQVGVVPLDVRQWVEFYPAAASSRMLSRLWSAKQAGNGERAGDQDLLDRVAAAAPNERMPLLQGAVLAHVSKVLRIPEAKLDLEAPLTSLGLDSLMGLELRNRIESMLGITVAATLLWTYPTIATLTKQLSARIELNGTPDEKPAPSAPVNAPPELSDDELLEALRSEI